MHARVASRQRKTLKTSMTTTLAAKYGVIWEKNASKQRGNEMKGEELLINANDNMIIVYAQNELTYSF